MERCDTDEGQPLLEDDTLGFTWRSSGGEWRIPAKRISSNVSQNMWSTGRTEKWKGSSKDMKGLLSINPD
jgi:hypothetical protein